MPNSTERGRRTTDNVRLEKNPAAYEAIDRDQCCLTCRRVMDRSLS